MKAIIFTLIAFTTFGLTAQETTEEAEDTTRFKVGTTEFIIINHGEGESDTVLVNDNGEPDKEDDIELSDNSFGHWSGFELGLNTMLNSKGSTSFNNQILEIDPAQSFNFAFNFGELKIPFGTPHVGLVTGMGFAHSRFGFKNNYVLNSNADSTWGTIDTTRSYSKNQFRTWNFNVPLLLEFNTSKESSKNVYFNFGIIGGVNFATKTFKKYDVIGGEQKEKHKEKFNINPFTVDATARVGYKSVGLFVNYSVLPLFETNKTELAYPLTFGIRFGS